mmetsp:Transcript_50571/g.161791  ORF Transcript_50571/g.161791 Transcript_50571/m.161791 type:complete len:218 (+) Transcript_50571:1792-2445(+)
MTLPRAVRLMLMLRASLSWRPSALDLLTRSEPARSTMLRVLWTSWEPSSATWRRVSLKTVWEREDTSFMAVDATRRTDCPRRMSSITSAAVVTSWWVRSMMTVSPLESTTSRDVAPSCSSPPVEALLLAGVRGVRADLRAAFFPRSMRSWMRSWYISTMAHVITVSFLMPVMFRVLSPAKRAWVALWTIPVRLASSGPNMLNVFPEPVWPYANAQAL